MHLIEITNDLYDIAARLRSVNDGYRVYYNVRLRRYEVHDVAQRGSTLAFVSPFDELDSRTVDYAMQTSVRNARKLFDELERENSRLDRQRLTRLVDEATDLNYKRRFYERTSNFANRR